MAKFLQDAAQDMALDLKRRTNQSIAIEFTEFMNKIKNGISASNEEVLKFSKLFQDEFSIDNLNRAQIVAMCKYMGINTFGITSFLRFQLKKRINKLREDDAYIEKEGIDSLNFEELQSACQARGIRSLDVSEVFMKNELRQWLQLSLKEKIPASLLILSRAFNITGAPQEKALETTLSYLPEDVIQESTVKIIEELKTDEFEKQLEIIKREEELIKLEKNEEQVSAVGHTPELSDSQKKELSAAVSMLSSKSLVENELVELEEMIAEQKSLKEKKQFIKEEHIGKEKDEQVKATIEQIKATIDHVPFEQPVVQVPVKEKEKEALKKDQEVQKEEKKTDQLFKRIDHMIENIAKEMQKN